MSIAVKTIPNEPGTAGGDAPARLALSAARRQGLARATALARQHWPFTVGLVTSALGVLIVILGWNGAANTTVLQYQLPYIISGGILGVGLVVLGAMYQVGYMLWFQQRKILEALQAPRVLAQSPVVSAAPADDEVVVVPGGASYHVATCRVATGKAGATRLTAPAAAARGLKPCRICH